MTIWIGFVKLKNRKCINKRIFNKLSGIIVKNQLLFLVMIFLLIGWGCKKNDNPVNNAPTGEPVPGNIFPLIFGHQFVYKGYLLDGAGNKIQETEALYFSSWTITNDTPLNAFFPSSAIVSNPQQHGVLIVDSTSVPGYISPQRNIPFFAYYDTSSGDYYYLTNFGYFFRSDSVFESSTSLNYRSDSLKFIKLASPKIGTIKRDSTTEYFTSYILGRNSPLDLRVDIIICFEKKENITLNMNGIDTTLTSYYLTVKSHPTSGALDLGETISAKFWLVEGIGPVQFFLAGDKETPGSFRQLTSKNF